MMLRFVFALLIENIFWVIFQKNLLFLRNSLTEFVLYSRSGKIENTQIGGRL